MNPKTVVVLAALMCSVTPVFAQQRAWLFDPANLLYGTGQSLNPIPTASSLIELDITNGGRDWSVRRRLTGPVQKDGTQPILLAGGRYVAWARAAEQGGDGELVRFDTRTGEVRTLTVPGLQTQLRPYDVQAQLAVDRRYGRVVIVDTNAIYILDPIRMVLLGTIALPAQPQEGRWIAVAQGRVFVGRFLGTDPGRQFTSVFDVANGAFLGTLSGVAGRLSRDERLLYTTRDIDRSLSLTAISVWSTATLQHVRDGSIVWSDWAFSVVDSFLVAFGSNARSETVMQVFDSASFQLRAESTYDYLTSGQRAEVFHASPTAPAVVRVYGLDSNFVCVGRLYVIDPQSGATITTIDERSLGGLSCTPPMLMLAAPQAPTALRAGVTNRTVTLDWQPPENVGDYEIVAGSAPGLNNIGTFRTGGQAFATFFAVPAGTYYVRVRAINELGAAESAEIKVVVP
jgi:hypothetical protein